jgi:hypothetical protein
MELLPCTEQRINMSRQKVVPEFMGDIESFESFAGKPGAIEDAELVG